MDISINPSLKSHRECAMRPSMLDTMMDKCCAPYEEDKSNKSSVSPFEQTRES
jgi:hypothetical protein